MDIIFDFSKLIQKQTSINVFMWEAGRPNNPKSAETEVKYGIVQGINVDLANILKKEKNEAQKNEKKKKKKENGHSWTIVLLKANINQSLYWSFVMWVVGCLICSISWICI